MTAISRTRALVTVILFLLNIFTVPAIDQLTGDRHAWRLLTTGVDRHTLRQFETALEDASPTARAVRPVVLATLREAFRSGTDTVHLGRGGELYYDPDFRHVTGRPFLSSAASDDKDERARRRDTAETARHADPIPAILRFRDQLGARGVALILMPTPVKPTIHPAPLYAGASPPIQNASFEEFLRRLTSEGVLVFDPTTPLLSLARDGHPTYLKTDTHWRPESVDAVARELARFVTERVDLPQTLGVRYARRANTVESRGDLATLLGSPGTESVTIQQVHQPNGQPWSPAPDTEILFLGDSFSNIYSADAMRWGQAAGLAEQLSFHLSRPLDAIRQNDHGAYATRQALADELARGNDRLAGKKLVVWQFAARELSFGDWKPINLPSPLVAPTPSATPFVIPPPGEIWTITGVIASKGISPRPGNTAYRDHVLAVHLTDVTTDGQPPAPAHALVYLRSMIDGRLTPAAALQPGQRVRLRVRDWSEVARQYETIQRSDVPDPALRAQPPCWGELLP